MKKIILALLILSGSFSIAQTATPDCSRLHHCKLKFVSKSGQSDFLEISGDTLKEYREEGGPYIKASLKWTSDCEYTANITEITFKGKDGVFKIGDELKAKIVKIEGKTLSMEVVFNDGKYEFEYEIAEYY